MKLKIDNKMLWPCFAKGTDSKQNTYIVYGGDLFVGEHVDVVPYGKNDKLYVIKQLDYMSTEIFKNSFDKDGLIKFEKIIEVKQKSRPFSRIYEIDGYWVFPEKKIIDLLEYLYKNGLIYNSRIKISKSYHSVISRAPVYAVDYQRILESVIKNKKPISSWFICEKEKDFDKGVYADLYVLGNLVDSNIQVQFWQIIGNGDEVLYAHMLLDKKSNKINHFDLATHFVNPLDIPNLIYYKDRIDLISKTKWIRVDEGIDENNVFELIKIFFPIDYLVDEFKEISST
ncbi:MAG: hypothetical protein HGA37_14305 [Lentimicrobium sp.]|jgi:hypothetical protein|nr:hypothetical protein [Lentimicrobium sp.]